MKRIISYILPLILVFSILIYAKDKYPEKIAKVKNIKGKAYWYIKGTKKRMKLQINNTLPLNSVIETKKSSKVWLLLRNAGRVEIGENSKVILNKTYLKKVKQALSIIKGAAKFKINKLKKKRKFEIYTPTAVVGVRGTEYEIQIAPEGSLAINVEEGTVEVNNESQTVKVQENQSCEAPIEEPTLEVEKKLRDMDEWVEDKEEEIKKNPEGKIGAIKERLEQTADSQQKIYTKIKKDKNKALQEVDDFQFNLSKSEGLFESANGIAKKFSKNKKVKRMFKTIKEIYSRLEKLNKILEERFEKLDKIYMKKSEELDKRLEEKEKQFEEKFKDFESE